MALIRIVNKASAPKVLDDILLQPNSIPANSALSFDFSAEVFASMATGKAKHFKDLGDLSYDTPSIQATLERFLAQIFELMAFLQFKDGSGAFNGSTPTPFPMTHNVVANAELWSTTSVGSKIVLDDTSRVQVRVQAGATAAGIKINNVLMTPAVTVVQLQGDNGKMDLKLEATGAGSFTVEMVPATGPVDVDIADTLVVTVA